MSGCRPQLASEATISICTTNTTYEAAAVTVRAPTRTYARPRWSLVLARQELSAPDTMASAHSIPNEK
eukprot:2945431-Pleurochrysis_carterae.AAC.2